jgi:Zn-dependent protease with chaperone function
LAHELGHLKCDHGVWLTFANILTMGAYSVPGRPSNHMLLKGLIIHRSSTASDGNMHSLQVLA